MAEFVGWLLGVFFGIWLGLMMAANEAKRKAAQRAAGRTSFTIYAPNTDEGQASGCTCHWYQPASTICTEAAVTTAHGWIRKHNPDCERHHA